VVIDSANKNVVLLGLVEIFYGSTFRKAALITVIGLAHWHFNKIFCSGVL